MVYFILTVVIILSFTMDYECTPVIPDLIVGIISLRPEVHELDCLANFDVGQVGFLGMNYVFPRTPFL